MELLIKKITVDVKDDDVLLLCEFLDIIPGVDEYDLNPKFVELAKKCVTSKCPECDSNLARHNHHAYCGNCGRRFGGN